MKRVCGLLILIMLLAITVASAEIRIGTDAFTGGSRYTSGSYLTNKQWIGFRKIIDGNKNEYEVLFSEEELNHVKFVQDYVELKIDANSIDRVGIKAISSMPTTNSDISFIRLNAAIRPDQIERVCK